MESKQHYKAATYLERREEVSNELAEIDAQRTVVVDGDLVAVKLVLYVHHRHGQAVCVNRKVLTGLG